ncbi:LptM family lipoprotein [Sporosarcina sp. FSL K6-3457]|uniref:LptM family lipoprotein n=1 Tax=Sporosarcina sp. FSL K6-3457 TaxID=2978204 RepID=UPI0030FC8074
MNRWLLVVCMILLLVFLTGCNTGYKGNPTPKDFLGNAEADIFVLDNIVHSNAQDVDWIQGFDYTLVEQIAEITKQSSISWKFKSGTANKLPAGTKIYNTDSGFLIAIVEGVEIPYLAIYEG